MKTFSIKNIAVVLCFVVTGHFASAQTCFRATSTFYGLTSPFIDSNYLKPNVDGKTHLVDKLAPADIITKSGNEFYNVNIAYDIVNDKVFAKTPQYSNLVELRNISSLRIKLNGQDNILLKSGFPSVDKYNGSTLYEVLVDAPLTLIKKNTGTLFERNTYGVSTKSYYVVDNNNYYLTDNKSSKKIKLNKESLLASLPGKKKEVSDFIEKNNINLKVDEELKKVIVYYNNL